MASNSKGFVSASPILTAGGFPQPMNLSSSVPIRAPLTLDDSDSEFELSSDATLSETASHSDLEAESHHASQEEDEDEECFELDEELSPLVQVPLRVTPIAHVSTYDDEEEDDAEEEEEDEEDDGSEMLSAERVAENPVRAFPKDTENDIPYGQGLRIRVASEGYSTASSIDSDAMSQCSRENSDDEQFEKVSVALNEFENDDMKLYGLDRNDEIRVEFIETDDVMQRKLEVVNNTETSDMVVEETSNAGSLLESNAEGYIDSVMPEQNISVDCLGERNPRTCESLSDAFAENFENSLEHCEENIEYSIAESEKLVSITETEKLDSMMLEKNTSVAYLEVQNPQTGESLGDALAENFENSLEHCRENVEYSTTATENISANGSPGVVAASYQESESEKLGSIAESVVDSKAIPDDSSVGFETNGDVFDGNKIQDVDYYEISDRALLQECTYLEKGLSETVLGVLDEDVMFYDYHSHENEETFYVSDTVNNEATVELNIDSQESKRGGSALDDDDDVEELMSARFEQLREQISALSILLGSIGSRKNSREEETVMSPHARMNLPKDDARSQLIYFDNGCELDCNSVTDTYSDQSSVHFLQNRASFSSLLSGDAQAGFQFQHDISENEKGKIHEIHTISVKFLRLVQRINFSLEDSLVSKVLCRLVADIGRRSHQEFVIRSAKVLAKKLEEDFQDDLDFSLNILVLGKSGVGKSATINSIFGDKVVMTDAFEPATTSVREVSGTVDRVKIRILDTPGLRAPMNEQAFNRKILSSVKRYMKKFPLDVILYVDRVDIQTADLDDIPILRSITNSLGPSIWQHAILTLTHAASTPLDGPSGSPLSYEVFVSQKSHPVQQSIIKVVGDQCQLSPSFMCPVSLVENHPLCGKYVSEDSLLPNGLRWRSQLLALCFSQKTLSQVSSVSIPCTLLDQWKHFLFQDYSQPLCHLSSCLLQSPTHHLKFSANWN
ncbi:translocase of chloroplast 159, chloroplastic [Vicia villosa]|uniref:translocase of chloroplast 159, chloroplastic n=1 Tax=Vicia villosa TaxID=3911 RepID=UPI00273CAA2C|nr:translocase of chloroplast 159, chloroplastic [Vicia villosa]